MGFIYDAKEENGVPLSIWILKPVPLNTVVETSM